MERRAGFHSGGMRVETVGDSAASKRWGLSSARTWRFGGMGRVEAACWEGTGGRHSCLCYLLALEFRGQGK